MASGFGELTTQAHELVAAGDLAGAQELLGDALLHADPSPYQATPELAEATGLHARLLLALGDAETAHGWAAFTHAAHTHLHGPDDQRTVAAAATLAAILHRLGDHAQAALLYRDVIIELTANDGPESLRVLAAHADLATVEYARGECELARNRLQDAWELHREVYGDGHLSGIKMLARLAAMERDCGEIAKAHQHFALAQQLCRENLPDDHPLSRQVDTLAGTPANPRHVCGGGPTVPEDPAASAVSAAPTTSGGSTDSGVSGPPAGAPYTSADPYAVPARERFTRTPPAYDRHTDPAGHEPYTGSPPAAVAPTADPPDTADEHYGYRYDLPAEAPEAVPAGWGAPAPPASDWPYGAGGPGAVAPADVFTTDVYTPDDGSTAPPPGALVTRTSRTGSGQGGRHLPERRQPAKPPVPIDHPPRRAG
ncbi:MAG TPA: tetratricopeptide repeat protein, partial [Micromonospora sp.]